MKLFSIAIAVSALTASLMGCASAPSQQEAMAADYGSYPSDYQTIIKRYMSARLKDGDSARYTFQNGPSKGYSRLGSLKYGYVVCASINAKNSYGAYVGQRPNFFMIKNGRVIYAINGDGNYGDAMAEGACSGAQSASSDYDVNDRDAEPVWDNTPVTKPAVDTSKDAYVAPGTCGWATPDKYTCK